MSLTSALVFQLARRHVFPLCRWRAELTHVFVKKTPQRICFSSPPRQKKKESLRKSGKRAREEVVFASGDGESAPLRAPLVRHRSGQKSDFRSAAASSSLRLSEGQNIGSHFSFASVFITKISSNGNVSHDIKTTDSRRATMSVRTQKREAPRRGCYFSSC